MALRSQIILILLMAVGTWMAVLWVTGPAPSIALLKPLGLTSGILTMLSAVYVKWVWKWPVLRGWLIQRPDLSGTWLAELESNFKKGGVRVRKKGYLVIRQDLMSLDIRLFTDQARSHSLSQNICGGGSGLFSVAAVYLNKPNAEARTVAGSTIHHGSVLIELVGYENSKLEGSYWTDQKTFGQIFLSERKKKLVKSFAEGQQLFQVVSIIV